MPRLSIRQVSALFGCGVLILPMQQCRKSKWNAQQNRRLEKIGRVSPYQLGSWVSHDAKLLAFFVLEIHCQSRGLDAVVIARAKGWKTMLCTLCTATLATRKISFPPTQPILSESCECLKLFCHPQAFSQLTTLAALPSNIVKVGARFSFQCAIMYSSLRCRAECATVMRFSPELFTYTSNFPDAATVCTKLQEP